MTAPRTVHFILQSWGVIVYYRNKYRVPGSYPLYLLRVHVSKRENKEKSSINKKSDKHCLKISQRYFKDCTASREQENSNVL